MPAYGDDAGINSVSLRLVPAGHVLGSAQAVEHGGTRIVVSGDYNRRPNRPVRLSSRCPATSCVREATSALPVFRHSDEGAQIARLPHSVATFPERAHLVGTYALEGAAGDPPAGRRLGRPFISTARWKRAVPCMTSWRVARRAALRSGHG